MFWLFFILSLMVLTILRHSSPSASFSFLLLVLSPPVVLPALQGKGRQAIGQFNAAALRYYVSFMKAAVCAQSKDNASAHAHTELPVSKKQFGRSAYQVSVVVWSGSC